MTWFDNILQWLPAKKNDHHQLHYLLNYSTDIFNLGNIDKCGYVELCEKINAFDSAISYLANIFKNAEIYAVNESGDVVEGDELVRLLKQPNKFQSQTEFLSEFYYNLRAAGWTYIRPFNQSVGFAKMIDRAELFNLNPDCIKFPNKNKSVFNSGDTVFKYVEKLENGKSEIPISTNDIIKFYDIKVDPNNPLKGVSRLASLRGEAKNTLLADRGKMNQIKRSGALLISHRERSNDGVSEGLDEMVDVTKGITHKQQIEQNLNGVGLAQGKSIVVSSKELRGESLAKDIIGIDFDKMKQADLRVIANKLGVPNELMPFEGDNAKYENRQEAQFSVIQNEIEPVARAFENGINGWFANHKNKIKISFEHLPAYQVALKRKEEVKNSIIERAEKLLSLGFELNEVKQLIKENEADR